MPPARTVIRGTSAGLATGLALSLVATTPVAADPVVPAPDDVTAPATPSATEPTAAEPAPFHDQEIDWAPCEEEILSSLECARIEVPLDYAAPDGERIEVGVLRVPATDPEARRGVLFLNFGGPGGPARFPSTGFAGTDVNEAYDIIGMDPRGVGASSPMDCGADYPFLVPRPTNTQITAHTGDMIRYSRACDAAQGDLRPYMTTANTARDMDVVRAVLGEERLNYLGYSYGTYLGAVYGSLFPERLDRSVLDSAIDPTEIWRGTFLHQAPAYTAGVERHAEWIAEHHGEYGLGTTTEEVVDAFHATSARLTEEPRTDVPGMEGMEFTGAYFDTFAGDLARYQSLWTLSTPFLAALALGEEEIPPPPGSGGFPEGVPPELYTSNFDLFSTLVCEADWPDRISRYHADTRDHRDRHPFGIGAHFASVQSCTFAGHQPTEPPVEVVRDGYDAGLVIGGEFDPQTPLAGSVAMAERLDNPLITVTDDGAHGFYVSGGDQENPYPCVQEAVDAYLIDGEAPGDLTCPGLPRPESVTDAPVDTYDDLEWVIDGTAPLRGFDAPIVD